MSRQNKLAAKRRTRAQLRAAAKPNQGVRASRRLERAARLERQRVEEQARLKREADDRLERERRRQKAEEFRMKRLRDSSLTPGPEPVRQAPRPGEIVGTAIGKDGKIRLVRKPVSHPPIAPVQSATLPPTTDTTERELYDRQLDAAIKSLRRTSPQSPGNSK